MSKSPRDTHGPIVKTGPTSGKNRSKNTDGRWRAKRSDSGKSRKSGGSFCFLSTAACQFKGLADDCYELEVLRDFRDGYLMTTKDGSKMVKQYYFIAPDITKCLVEESDLNKVWDTVIECVEAIELRRYQDAIRIYKSMVESMQAKFAL
jgi:hypothetical protein